MKETDFIPLEKGVSENIKGLYLINELGEIKRISDGRIFSVMKNLHKGGDGYPRVHLPVPNKPREVYLIHRLIAFNFIPNDDPENKTYVDHLDRNKQNFKKSNLLWKDSSSNMKNREFKRKETDRLIFLKKDVVTRNIVEVLRSEVVGKEARQSIYNSERNNVPYLGYYWETIDLRLEIFYNKFGLPSVWKRIKRFKISEVYCSDNGLIKFKNKGGNFEITPGHKNEAGYLIFNCEKKGYRVHRLVYETFMNNGEMLDTSVEIDHWSTDVEDNSTNNLRLCHSHRENINNPKTLENLGRPVSMFSIFGKYLRTFKSLTDAYNFLGCKSNNSRLTCICSGTSKSLVYRSYLWSYSNSEINIREEMKTRLIFQYDQSKNLINVYNKNRCYSEIEKWSKEHGIKFEKFYISKYIDTGKLAPDGHYYYHGPHEFTEGEGQNKNQDLK